MFKMPAKSTKVYTPEEEYKLRLEVTKDKVMIKEGEFEVGDIASVHGMYGSEVRCYKKVVGIGKSWEIGHTTFTVDGKVSMYSGFVCYAYLEDVSYEESLHVKECKKISF